MCPTAVRIPVRASAVRTRGELVRAAEAEFAERGYASTTARSITERADVALGSFYQYFPDKDALLRELTSLRQSALMRQLTQSYEGLPHAPAEVEALVQRILQVVVDYHRESPGLHAVISERRHADPELATLIATGEKALVQALLGVLKRQERQLDPLATAFVLFGLVEGAVHAHVLGGAMVSDARFMAALVAATLRVAFPSGVESPAPKRKPRSVSSKLSNRR